MTPAMDRDALERQRKMFGCTVVELREGVESSITNKTVGWPMVAAGMMSDAQELIEFGELERARQILNRSKWVVFEYADRPR
jgi:hypothetical protein